MKRVPPATTRIPPARALVAALDHDDFVAARACLADDCRYEVGEEILVGPDAILASYEANARWARETLNRVEYASHIEQRSEQVLEVTFIDRLGHAGIEHEYRCRQTLTTQADGRVCGIRHEELPGERERLRDFFRRAGIDPHAGSS